MGYELGIDVGTSYTAAAIYRDGRADVFELGSHSAAIPTVVLLAADGTDLVGEVAEWQAAADPDRVAREFKRRVGDPVPILVSGQPFSADDLMGRVIRWVVAEVSVREGASPGAITITHPANWGPYKLEQLRQAAYLADLDPPLFLSEPEAAARHYAAQQRVRPDAVVAVYDLGGGTFDVALLRRAESGGFQLAGEPGGIERLGGIDFDEAVFGHVQGVIAHELEQLDANEPAAIRSLAQLRRECVTAKEVLSGAATATIPVMLPGLQTEVRLTRPEFESMIRPSLLTTISVLDRTLRAASLTADDIDAVLLVGGSSRIPLVAELISAELGRPVAIDTHPKFAVALGAARAAGEGDSPVKPFAPENAAPAEVESVAAAEVGPAELPTDTVLATSAIETVVSDADQAPEMASAAPTPTTEPLEPAEPIKVGVSRNASAPVTRADRPQPFSSTKIPITEAPHAGHRWRWTLVALVAVLLIGGVIAIAATQRDDPSDDSGAQPGAGAAPSVAVPSAEDEIAVTVGVADAIVLIDTPDIIGHTEMRARFQVEDAGLVFEVGGTAGVLGLDETQVDRVLDQTPAGGSPLMEGGSVSVIIGVAEPADQVVVPGVVGWSEASAQEEIEAVGLAFLRVEREAVYDSETVGYVHDQDPSAGEVLDRGQPVTVTVFVPGGQRASVDSFAYRQEGEPSDGDLESGVWLEPKIDYQDTNGELLAIIWIHDADGENVITNLTEYISVDGELAVFERHRTEQGGDGSWSPSLFIPYEAFGECATFTAKMNVYKSWSGAAGDLMTKGETTFEISC